MNENDLPAMVCDNCGNDADVQLIQNNWNFYCMPCREAYLSNDQATLGRRKEILS